MACYKPLYGTPSGKNGRMVVSSSYFGPMKQFYTIPCGHCIGCRVDRSREWATRCVHEASLHKQNAFVTLTFNDDNLPDDYSVHVRDMQLFMKRVRKVHGSGIRFFACGEYGEQNRRPHYHVLLFGLDFAFDRYIWRKNYRGDYLYRSPSLEKLWPLGQCEIGDVTSSSASYVARYIFKKVTGDEAEAHYKTFHPVHGHEVQQNPEFVTMSRKPGIGSEWFTRYSCDLYPSGFVVVDGSKRPIPRFYRNKLSEEEREILRKQGEAVQERREPDAMPKRLAVREEVLTARLRSLKREL